MLEQGPKAGWRLEEKLSRFSWLRSELNDVTGHLLRKSHLTAQKCFADAFAGTDISPIQYALLSTIGSNPGVNHRDLAAAIATAASVATTALKPLLEQGAVLSERDREDSRSTTYRLSKRGGALLGVLRKRLELTSETLEKPLTKKEAEQLKRLLTKLIGGASS